MKTVYFDVDTQIDFVYPAGALAVPGAEAIVGNLAALTRHAVQRSYQIIATADAHSENDPEFKVWKPHCVIGTVGQRRCAATTADSHQVLIEKQQLDCFTNPKLRPLLAELRPDRYVVYGVVSEYCVQCAAFGLLEAGARVELVTDAIKCIDPSAERNMIAEFKGRGGLTIETHSVIARGQND